MYARILIATDGSELAAKGLRKGAELAAQLGAQVDVVTVSEPWAVGMYDAMGWTAGYEASDEYKQDREAAAQKILQPALEEVRAAGVAGVTGHHVLDRYAADGRAHSNPHQRVWPVDRTIYQQFVGQYSNL